jgi:UDP-glucose 4-epimerase
MNIGSGTGRSINDIVRDIESILGRPVPRRYRAARAADVPVNILNSTLAHSELGWQPRIAWIDGLRDTVDWMRKRLC